jgi:transposase
VIALIVNREGFPFSYETFDGNRADVSTMETILRMVERKYGKARRIWVMDRGLVSEENLEAKGTGKEIPAGDSWDRKS